MPRIPACLGLAALLVCGSGCSYFSDFSMPLPSFYKTKVRQGNYLDEATLGTITPGMSKREVQQRLGTPLVTDPFHQNRWDYVYSYRPGTYDNGEPEQRRVTLYFERDVLSRVEYPPQG